MYYPFYFTLYCVTLLVLTFFGAHKAFLLMMYLRHRNEPQSTPVTPDEWPSVTVQLPVYNERYVLTRLLRAVAGLDYPREKLHIQLLDDSTDMTASLAARFVSRLQSQGFTIDHIRRPDRTGFKAGALEYGLEHSDAAVFAIFDADFVPQPDFLKQTIPSLLQPNVGMVQARWGHDNRGYSLLTRLQALYLDGHFFIEHLARNRSGRFFNFNGTAGVWHRQAIVDAGGWKHDTLTEDLDLSYRAQLAGWKFIYLPDVITPAELPVELNAYKSQQYRWAKGSIQTALKLVPSILKSDMPLYVRLEAIIHLTGNITWLMMVIPALLMVPLLKYQVHHGIRWPIILYLAVFFASTMSVVMYYGYTLRESTGKLWPSIMYIPLLMALGMGLSINNGRAVLEGLLGKDTPFIRTPKLHIRSKKDTARRKIYHAANDWYFLLEFLLGCYFTWGMAIFFLNGIFLSIPFFLLFQAGFFYVSLTSVFSNFSLAHTGGRT